MLRVAFLFLVVLGALAVFLGLAAGVGVWQAARLQQPAADLTPAASPATVPAAGVPAATATRPAARSSPAAEAPSAADAAEPPGPDAKADRPNRPAEANPAGDAKPRRLDNGDADWPPPDPAGGGRRRRPPGDRDDFVLPLLPLVRPLPPGPPRVLPVDPAVKPVVLDAKSADVRGTGGLRAAGDGDRKALVDWRAESDVAVWTVDVPTTGIYVVEAEYACDAGAGGPPPSGSPAFRIQFVLRDLPGPKPRVTGVVAPTGGWDDYRTAPVGQTYLPAGKTEVLMRPVSLKGGRRLPNVRAIRLRLVTDEREKDRGAAGAKVRSE